MHSHRKAAVNSLSSELLAHVMSYLSASCPGDIASCRLVNRAFNEHSSPYLIPRVLFARRLDVLSRLCQIMTHPYFSLHVTELVYDGSAYSEATALDLDQYVEDCERAPRDLRDERWMSRQRCIRATRREILRFCRDRDGKLQPDEPTTAQSRQLSRELDVETSPFAASVGADDCRLACSFAFATYQQRYRDQEWISSEAVDMSVLLAAFTRFPKLRSIVATDYRSLARRGESYDECCRRLFGKTLEPQHVGAGGETGVAGDCLFSLMEILAKTSKTQVNRLAVGPHAFEYTGEDASELADPYHPRNPRYLDVGSFHGIPLGPCSAVAGVLGHLETLRLVLCYSGNRSDEDHVRDQLRQFLRSAAPRLQVLTLNMIYLFWGGREEIPRVSESVRFDVFPSVLAPIRMPYLRSLSLRRWIFTADKLKAFLLAHTETLCDLHLLACLCGDDEWALAHWGSQNLNLTSVELTGFLAVLDYGSANPHHWQNVSKTQWNEMRPDVNEQHARALEGIWLRGRPNKVIRQQRQEDMPSRDWWKWPKEA
ncbi:hypothetical protein WHR41_09334 [Cladosporium halotolerans]|uniref:F-box domain-containing protein n=1 Tax=Cladosporium halotolerans TaxID=1052096 RepID=A0AB34KEM4_9PEZI